MSDNILTNSEYLCRNNKAMNYTSVAGYTFTYVSPTTGGETAGIIASHFVPLCNLRKMKNGKMAHRIELHVVSELGNSYDMDDVYFDNFTL